MSGKEGACGDFSYGKELARKYAGKRKLLTTPSAPDPRLKLPMESVVAGHERLSLGVRTKDSFKKITICDAIYSLSLAECGLELASSGSYDGYYEIGVRRRLV